MQRRNIKNYMLPMKRSDLVREVKTTSKAVIWELRSRG